LLVVILISVYIFSIRDQAAKLAIYGYPGIFLISFLAYATVILPAPGIAIIFTMGTIFNPLAVGLAAGAGAALGELVGYLAGFSGQAVVERADQYERLTRWMQKNGGLTVFLLALIPNPFFDLAGVCRHAQDAGAQIPVLVLAARQLRLYLPIWDRAVLVSITTLSPKNGEKKKHE
jgi:membrane protein YqaA with SNARE-associated domain